MELKMLDHAKLIDALEYNENTGEFIWRKKIASKVVVGKRAGNNKPIPNGYLTMRVFGKNYYQHRMAWFYVHGRWPKHEIDHINQDKTDNRISNLREVTRLENCRNSPLRPNNTSGYCGVVWDKSRQVWVARIIEGGREKFLGYFNNKEDAAEARKQAEQRLGFHENHGAISDNGAMLRTRADVLRGVSLDCDKWRASMRLNGATIHLGMFEDWFDAICARKSAENRYFTGANNDGRVDAPPSRPPKSTTGVEGVGFESRSRKWRARIKDPLTGKWKSLGYYSEFDDAVAARKEAEVLRGLES
jgi:HNH endonuclease